MSAGLGSKLGANLCYDRAMNKRLLACLVVLLCGASPYRTWTSSDGKHATEARLLDHDTETIYLLKQEPQKNLAIPLGYLGDDDKAFIAADKTKVIEGKVIALADGDTLTVLQDKKQYKIRLIGIDTPEKRQDYGRKAQTALGKLVFNKQVRVRWSEQDKYKRYLGNVYVEGLWVNLKMVADGWAWHFVKYSDDPDLAKAEKQARKAKIGLWADPNEPQAPWDFRNPPIKPPIVEVAKPEKPEPSEVVRPVVVRNHWLNTNSNVRHNRSCRNYNNTKHGRPCTATEGKPCGICGG